MIVIKCSACGKTKYFTPQQAEMGVCRTCQQSGKWRPGGQAPWRYFLTLMRQIREEQGDEAWEWALGKCISHAKSAAKHKQGAKR